MITKLQDYVTRAADKDPERSALVMGQNQLSYADLEEYTNRLAHLLRYEGCAEGARVCVVGAKTPWTIASLIAILKAGGVYVPIDSASPAARVGRIFSAAEPSMVLVDASASALVDDLVAAQALSPDVRIGGIDGPVEASRFRTGFARADIAAFGVTAPPRAGRPDDIAHILFTSGSTGVPKGVVITHANVIAFVEWAVAYFGTEAGDRISAHPPLHFDLSTFDIYATFAAGAELHPVPASLALSPRGLASFIRNHELTQWFSVPSVLTYMAKFDVVAQDDFPALERLLWCGEVLPTPVLMYWMKRVPHAGFTNLYGPTEATIASSYYTLTECPAGETEQIPIGTPCAGEELLVLDSWLRPAGPHEIGDLYIGGVGLSPGYWRDEEKTAAVFVPDPRSQDPAVRIYRTGDLARRDENGIVHFLGRADSQIKSRGYRIELGEIEAAVNVTTGVRECAAVGVEIGGFEGTTICCAFSVRDGAELSPVDLRKMAERLLPSYMLPAHWALLEELPKNVNGKIDRKAVREYFTERVKPSSTKRGRL